MNTHWFK